MARNDNWTDKDIAAAFVRMASTLGVWISWLIFTLFWGIGKGWAFFDNETVQTWQHSLFYIWIVCTLPLLIWVTKAKIWRNKQ
jgi:hypothetical protein